MNGLFYLIASIVLSILNCIIVVFMSYKFLHTYQLNNYHVGRLLNWYRNTNGRYFKRLTLISLLSLAGLMVTNILFHGYAHEVFTFSGLIFYFVISAIFVKYESKIPKKKPLVLTARMKREYAVIILLTFGASLGIFKLNYDFLHLGGVIASLRFVFIAITPLLVPIIVFLSAVITAPFENINNRHYIKKAGRTLSERKDLIKIGITGSYAKTSVKKILATILSKKYKVKASPESFNTPLGITRSVGTLKSDDEVFIAEMGARNIGNIKELCQMVEPQYGIITGISNQHLESFFNIGNVIKTKCELSDNLAKRNGLTVVNGDTRYFEELKAKIKGEYLICGTENTSFDVYAENVTVTGEGSEFDLVFDNKKLHCTTKLLGKHNISNIVLATGLAYKLGVSDEQLVEAISELEPPKHRLNLMTTPNGMKILDDTFNANVDGVKHALELLSIYDGRKIIVTPGLVELGADEKKANKNFGRDIAKVCDLVFLIGKTRSEPIKEGLIEEGFSEENILVYNSLSDAKREFKKYLCATDVVLLENDLPDDYNEVEPLK